MSPSLGNEIAPTGKLRVGVNLGNFLLVSKDPASGRLHGVVPDLAAELGRRLGVPVEPLARPGAGEVADAVAQWDVAFIGAEAKRAELIVFTTAYLEIPATYLAPAGSRLRSIEEVDRPGVRILQGRFTAVRQAIGTPKARAAAARTLQAFVDDIKASGLVAQLIERHGAKAVNVPR